MKRWLSNILLVIFAAVFAVCAYILVDYFLESRQQQGDFDELAALVGTRPQLVIPTEPENSESTQQTVDPNWGGLDLTPNVDPNEGLIPINHPDTGELFYILPEYATVFMKNTDMVGWMTIPGTKINYPVMQTPDNKDYYLYRDFYKKSSTAGCLYVREECDVFAPSDNLTIYGHKKNDGTMFAALHNYKKKSFWEENRYFTFDTLKERQTFEVMSVFITTASVGEGFNYHLFVDAHTEKQFNEFVDTCKELALYDTGVDAQYGDKFITLSTCDFGRTNGRFVVVAKRVA